DFESDAVAALRRGRELQLLVLPARLEENNPRRLEFLNHFEETFGKRYLPDVLRDQNLTYESLALPYVPELAIMERLVGPSDAPYVHASQKVADAYERLADALTLLAHKPGALRQQ